MKIALAQINTTVGDLDANARKIAEWSERARAAGAGVVVFPELALCGYPPQDLVAREAFVRDQLQTLDDLAAKIHGITVIVGFIDRSPKGRRVSNSAAVISEGRIVSRHAKCLLPTYDVFDEGRYFEAGGKLSLANLAGKKTAITICEDLWNEEGFEEAQLYTRKPVAEAVEQGAEWIFNLSASPFHLDKSLTRERLAQSVAKRTGKPVFYVNLVGGNDSLIFDGGSFAVDAGGRTIARAKTFEEDLLVIEVEAKAGLKGSLAPSESCPAVQARQALVLGLRDYARKCGFEKALVGLSGGIDSAVTAALAVEALGAENIWGVAMPSRYSSKDSLEDAEVLARNLKIRFDQLPIEKTFEAFLATLAPLFQDRPANVAEENLQARIRGTLLMALSNKFGYLLLTTGNKSEMAVGYCTLYGDMNGGLAVIADVPKLLVYQIAQTYNETKEKIPKRSLTKPPSAELRPNQKDSDSLPPYDILDPILAAFIEGNEDTAGIVNKTQADPAIVERVLKMVDGAEYKRRQAPPALRITPKAFGTGRRLPIAQRYPTWKA